MAVATSDSDNLKTMKNGTRKNSTNQKKRRADHIPTPKIAEFQTAHGFPRLPSARQDNARFYRASPARRVSSQLIDCSTA